MPTVDLPEVTGAGYDPANNAKPVLIVSPMKLVMGSTESITLHDGSFDPADKKEGFKIPKLTAWLAASQNDRSSPLVIAFDRNIPYRTFMEVLFSAKQHEAGWKRFYILAHADAQVVMLRLDLPEKSELEAPPSPDPPLNMVVSVTNTNAIVWSISGLEGTLRAPKQTFTLGPTTGADIQRVLAEIVARRYPDGKRPTPLHRRIIFMADGTNQLADFAELLGVIRVTADGKELFPHVLLSSGFE